MGTIQEHNWLSVIIPTLDAADDLGGALAQLNGVAMIGEIIIADGGSRDGTPAIARSAGATVIAAERGRGSQLAAGAAAAGEAWLLFLHADCRLGGGWQCAVADFAAASGSLGRAGYFAFGLDDESPAAQRLERIVAWRCRTFALPYGDQGLLISRWLYNELGGFAALPLMEDVEFARRLGRRRLVALPARVVSSARRYRAGGYVRRPLRNLFCLALYLTGVAPRRIARLYS